MGKKTTYHHMCHALGCTVEIRVDPDAEYISISTHDTKDWVLIMDTTKELIDLSPASWALIIDALRSRALHDPDLIAIIKNDLMKQHRREI